MLTWVTNITYKINTQRPNRYFRVVLALIWSKKSLKSIEKGGYLTHYMKSVQIQSLFWSEYGKIHTRKNSVFGHFSRNVFLSNYFKVSFMVNWSSRTSHPEVFLRKGVLKICSKSTGKHPCWSVISIKLLCNFVEIAFRHGCSPANLLHIFRILFPKSTYRRLLLQFKEEYSHPTA